MKTCFKLFSLSIIVLTVVCLIAGPTSAETESIFLHSTVSEVIDDQGLLSGAGIVITPNQTVMKAAISVNKDAPLLDSGSNCNNLGIPDQCGIYQLDGFELSLDSYNLPSCDTSSVFGTPDVIRFYDRWASGVDLIAFFHRCVEGDACFPAWMPDSITKIITEIRLYAADNTLWSGLAIPQDFYSAMKEMTMDVVAKTDFINADGVTVAKIEYGFDTYSFVEKLSCLGFEAPMDSGAVTVKKSRALPLKAQLINTDGLPVADVDISSSPIIQVLFDSGTGGDPVDITDISYPVGEGTDGNQFVFTDEGKWQFNLKTSNYTAPGTYKIFMDTGDDSEYVITPQCQAEFVIK